MEYTSDGVTSSTIFDVSTGRMVMLWHNSKRAYVTDSKQMSESLAKNGVPATKHSIVPTVEWRQIAGSTCSVHQVKASFAYPEYPQIGGVPGFSQQ
jgi:hypothetical protein